MESRLVETRPEKARPWIKVAACVICAAFLGTEVWGAAAIGYDKKFGILGYGIDEDKDIAIELAFDDVLNNGGTKAKKLFAFGQAGWGASAFSDNGGPRQWSIGGALGYNKKKRAKQAAIEECQAALGIDCQIVDVFHDTVGKKPKKNGGKRFRFRSE